MSSLSTHRRIAFVAAAIGLSGAVDVHALDIDLSIYAESEYTTNTARTAEDEVEEWIHAPGVNLAATHEGAAVELDVTYDFRRLLHQQDLYEDENEAAGSASLVWHALPERLDFLVDHTRTQTAIEAIEAITPDNRQEVSISRAGPLLRLNPRGDDEIQLQYEYGDRTAEDTDNDSITHTSSARYILALSQNHTWTFEGINQQVQFENPVAADIEYNTAKLIWHRTTRDLEFDLAGGYTETKRTKGLDNVDGAIFELSAQWQARPTTQVLINAARDVRDQSERLGAGSFADDLDASRNSDLAEVFTSERATVTIRQQLGRRTTLDLAAQYDEEDYEDADRDTETQSLRLGLTRRVRENVGFSAGVAVDKQKFSSEGDEADTLRCDANLEWEVGRRLNVSFGVLYEERDSDSGDEDRTYDEWIGRVRLSYALID